LPIDNPGKCFIIIYIGKDEIMQKMIAVDQETYNKIKALADSNGRTIGGQVAWFVKNISLIPAPDGATPVVVLNVKEKVSESNGNS
jgi:hypothetical protein